MSQEQIAPKAPRRATKTPIDQDGEEEVRVRDSGAQPADSAPPLPLKLETGTMPPDSPFYVRRPTDDVAEQQVLETGATTIIRAPRQFGKSSLLARMNARAKANGQCSWYFDFQLLDESSLADLNTLLLCIARDMAADLQCAYQPDDHWNERRGPSLNLTRYVEDALLRKAQTSVQIIFDEADCVFHRPYREDFFGAVRAWHNRRATHPESGWRNLNIVIAHATDPMLWITNHNRSPFNVGTPLRLPEFDFAAVSELNEKHGRPLGTDQIPDLMNLVGGHPFLVRAALCELAKSGQPLSTFVEVAADQDGPFSEHLRRLLQSLRDDDDLKDALRQVIHRRMCDKEVNYQRLWAAGFIRGEHRNDVQMRCELYRRYFEKHL